MPTYRANKCLLSWVELNVRKIQNDNAHKLNSMKWTITHIVVLVIIVFSGFEKEEQKVFGKPLGDCTSTGKSYTVRTTEDSCPVLNVVDKGGTEIRVKQSYLYFLDDEKTEWRLTPLPAKEHINDK